MTGTDPDIPSLLERLDRITAFHKHLAVINPGVSNWSIGQQAEHVVRATSAFTVLILRNRVSDGNAEVKPIKDALLSRGFIPRGAAEAPEGTHPAADTDPAQLYQLLLKTRNRVERLIEVDPDAVAVHPYLGEMKRDEIIRFMVIHLDHHLSIMREILESGS